MELGNHQEAINLFKKIKRYFNSSVEVKYYRAKCLLVLDRKSEAIFVLEEAASDYRNELRFSHYYVEMHYQIYIRDIEELKSDITIGR